MLRLKAVDKPRARVVCFPYAGGNAVAFHPWGAHVPEGVELWASQYPGRGYRFRDPPFTRLADLLAEQLPWVRKLCDVPTVFFGHSMGATVAFELAQLLRGEGGAMPGHLFLSARAAPQESLAPDPAPPALPHMSDAMLASRLQALSGTPSVVLENPDLMNSALRNLRADLQCLQGWRTPARQPLPVPITVFGGDDDPHAMPEGLQAWRRHTTAAFHRHQFPGHHFFLRDHYPAMLRCMFQQGEP